MTVKSLAELNSEFFAEQKAHGANPARTPVTPIAIGVDPPKYAKKKKGAAVLVLNILLCAAILCILIVAVIPGAEDGMPKSIFGFSFFNVITGSMGKEIPKDSLILVKYTDPNDLKIGDNITYLRDNEPSVTHKITEIYENYNDSGARGFQTWGNKNANPDKDVVPGDKVVGKAVFVIPALGAVWAFLAAHKLIAAIFVALCVIITVLIRITSAHQAKRVTRESLF